MLCHLPQYEYGFQICKPRYEAEPVIVYMAFRSENPNLVIVVVVVFIIGVKMVYLSPRGTLISRPRTWMKHGEDGGNNFVRTSRNVRPPRNQRMFRWLSCYMRLDLRHRKYTSIFHLQQVGPRIIMKPFWINLGLSVSQGRTLYSNNTGSGAGASPKWDSRQ